MPAKINFDNELFDYELFYNINYSIFIFICIYILQSNIFKNSVNILLNRIIKY